MEKYKKRVRQLKVDRDQYAQELEMWRQAMNRGSSIGEKFYYQTKMAHDFISKQIEELESFIKAIEDGDGSK